MSDRLIHTGNEGCETGWGSEAVAVGARANFAGEETRFESTPRRWIYFFKPDNEEGNAADTFSRKINDSRSLLERWRRDGEGAGLCAVCFRPERVGRIVT